MGHLVSIGLTVGQNFIASLGEWVFTVTVGFEQSRSLMMADQPTPYFRGATLGGLVDQP